MYSCKQPKGWMDNRVIELWKEKIWKPYVEGTSKSASVLYQMESHRHPTFVDLAREIGIKTIEIPGRFTSVSQPCDFRVIKPFKTQLVELFQQCMVDEHPRLGGIGKIPTHGRKR